MIGLAGDVLYERIRKPFYSIRNAIHLENLDELLLQRDSVVCCGSTYWLSVSL